MRILLANTVLLVLSACSHRQPMGEGCIDGVVRELDLRFVAEGSGREYTVLTGDGGSREVDLRPYAGRRVTICGPVGPRFHIQHARIAAASPIR